MIRSNTLVTMYIAVNIGNYICIYYTYYLKNRLICYFSLFVVYYVDIPMINIIAVVVKMHYLLPDYHNYLCPII